jgi:hypothetical protein
MSVRSIPLIFEDVAAANSFGARKKVLLENESNPLKDLLKYAFHPDIKFALPSGSPPFKTVGSPDEYNPTYLYPNIKKFYLYIEGGHDGLTALRREQLFVQRWTVSLEPLGGRLDLYLTNWWRFQTFLSIGSASLGNF